VWSVKYQPFFGNENEMKTTRMLLIVVLALGLAAEVANADFVFGTPTNLGLPVNSSVAEGVPSISNDGLALYFGSNRGGAFDLWVATRATTKDNWSMPVSLGSPVNSSSGENGPSISVDGLSLYFHSLRPDGYGHADIWVTTRETTSDSWGEPVNLGPTVNSSNLDAVPSISTNALSLYFTSERPGGSGSRDIWVTTRAMKDDPWGEPVNLGPPVNSSYYKEAGPRISADDLSLFFVSNRPGGYGDKDLWVSTRATTKGAWGKPVNLGSTVNSPSLDGAPNISADGLTLFFVSGRPGGYGGWDLWQVPIVSVVDPNGDEIVDSTDMCMIVDRCGTNEPLCDIAPMPWSYGIVDVQDLIVFADHLLEEIFPIELVAYWKQEKAKD
jgi:Tol biopolymer transport system component